MGDQLTFAELRRANLARVSEFGHGGLREWGLAQWSNACLGELGEAANLIKKVERGDCTLGEVREELAKEFADVVCYLDLLAARAGVDLAMATVAKFNEVSVRISSPVRLQVPEQPAHQPDKPEPDRDNQPR
ncbi:MAG: MazG-like family protein [Myxococcales bacterium]|nr:MazG-like family protein [Myxococcales bacterium]